MMTGAEPEQDIDHVDGIRTNNSWANLRSATRTQNNYNRKATAEMKGAHPHRNGKYRSRIKVRGKEIHLGVFNSVEDANAAYADAALSAAGKFARSQ
jgi:hypothetical protein